MMKKYPIVLIHSPLVGTFTWQAAAEYLRSQGETVYVPELSDSAESNQPFWQQEVESIDLQVAGGVLVGHSGAGALLPLIGRKLGISAYIFVDAVLLFEPASRLDLLYAEDGTFARQMEQMLKSGGQFPNWQDEHLQTIIPDAKMRQTLLSDVRPRSLHFFTERIGVPLSWDSKPCAYIQLSESYQSYASEAERRNWLVVHRQTHHFEMLTHPEEIGQLLVHVKSQLGR